jgi:hypothetical protein
MNFKAWSFARSFFSMAYLMLLAGFCLAFDGNSYPDLAIGSDCYTSSDTLGPGSVSIISSNKLGLYGNGGYFTQDEPGVPDDIEDEDRFGYRLVSGDFNGDGFADLAIAANCEDIGDEVDAGAVTAIYGTPKGLSATLIPAQFIYMDILGIPDVSDNAHSDFGDMMTASDFNGDGFDDLAISAPYADVSGIRNAGAVYVICGSPKGLDLEQTSEWTQDSDDILGGCEENDLFGLGLASGDINGDGFGDLAIGAYDAIGDVVGAGCVNFIYGSASGLSSAGNQCIWQGKGGEFSGVAETDDHFGEKILLADFNGDGYDDAAVSAPNESVSGDPDPISSAGVVSVMYGSASGIVSDGNVICSSSTLQAFEDFGHSLAGGDINGDSFDDLVIGSPGKTVNSWMSAGEFSVLYGSSSGIDSTHSEPHHQGDGVAPDTAEHADEFG